MIKTPDVLCIDKRDRQLYDDIARESIFKDHDRKEQFLVAMATGFGAAAKRPLEGIESSGFFRTSYLQPQDRALINAVAVAESQSVDVLLDPEAVFRTAEEYAHGGIQILHGEIMNTQYGSFDKRFEKVLSEAYDAVMDKGDEENPAGRA